MADEKDQRVEGVNTMDSTDPPATTNGASESKPEETVENFGTHATEASAPAASDDKKDTDEKKDVTDEPATNGAGENADSTPSKPTADTNGASSSKKDNKRKSTGGVPEHKGKKLNKKKSMPNLHLDVEPGQYWFAQMKGYPPWPSIIVDDDMLPSTLLENRPVSAKQANGEYRIDFQEGGKNIKDRRYPVMFLYTNEFAWHVNTELAPLNMDDLKAMVEKDDRGKKGKQIWEAYKVAAQNNNLDHFRQMLMDHEEQMRQAQEEEEQEALEKEKKKAAKAEKAEKAAAAPKKKAAKPKETATDEDVEMEDADAEDGTVKAPKSASKKRKKEAAEGDDEPEKPAKTPKTIKLTGLNNKEKDKTEDAASAKKKTPKSTAKKPTKSAKEAKDKDPDAGLTEEQKREKREKMVLYLRHKLQKGFLTRDQKPKEDEMNVMDEQFKQLESLNDLDATVIRKTKINKVLKAILKLTEIPREDEFKFKERSSQMLSKWAPILGIDDSAKTEAASTANGTKHEDSDKAEAKNEDEKEASEKPESDEKATETKTEDDEENEKVEDAPKAESTATEVSTEA